MTHARSRGNSARRYPRMARVNELLREILGEALERIDDDRLLMVTVTAVECDPDLRHAKVFVDTLADPAQDDLLREALHEMRPRLQAEIGRQARLKRTPELIFKPDAVGRGAARLEEVLREIHNKDD